MANLFKGTTEAQIADVQKRLHAIHSELDALNLGTTPTADLEAEEAAALKRLARKEALSRVSSALGAELAELKNKLAAEQEAEKKRQIAKLETESAAAKSKAADELFTAYEAMQAWEEVDVQLGTLSPGLVVAGRMPANMGKLLADMLAEIGAAKVTVDGGTWKRNVTRI